MDKDYETRGKSVHLDMWGIEPHVLNNEPHLRNVSRFALAKANAEILDYMYWQFKPNGLTLSFILAESSYDLHTYPSRGYLAANIHTCGSKADPNLAADYLIDHFRPSRIVRRELERGV